jgi:hypothetical protein
MQIPFAPLEVVSLCQVVCVCVCVLDTADLGGRRTKKNEEVGGCKGSRRTPAGVMGDHRHAAGRAAGGERRWRKRTRVGGKSGGKLGQSLQVASDLPRVWLGWVGLKS